MEEKNQSIFFPLLLIGAGILMLLNVLNVLSGTIGEYFAKFWPVLLIVAGLDGLYKQEGITSPLVGITLGSIFLLSTMGILHSNPLELIFRLWPLLLIGWGVDLLLPKKTAFSRFLAVIIGMILMAAIGWLAIAAGSPAAAAKNIPLQQSTGRIENADITLENHAGQIHISAGPADTNLISGSYSVIGTEKAKPLYLLQGTTGFFQLKSEGMAFPVPFAGSSQLANWNIQINPTLPISLNSRLIMGNQTLDLQTSQVKTINSETIVGSTHLILPPDPALHGKASAVFGKITLTIPRNIPVIIHTHLGLASADIPDGFVREKNMIYSFGAKSQSAPLTLTVTLPVGIFTIDYAE